MRKPSIGLLAGLLALAGFLPAFLAGVEPALDQGCPAYAWTDNRGPGNGQAFALRFSYGGNPLYRGTSRGVRAYDPATGVWNDADGALGNYAVMALAGGGGRLYAGTAGQGVRRYDMETGAWTDTGGAVSSSTVFALSWTASSWTGPEDGPQDFEIPGNSRESFRANDAVTDYEVSTKVGAQGGNVICERAMCGKSDAWAHDSIGYSQ